MPLAQLLIQTQEQPDGQLLGRAWRMQDGVAQPVVGNWSAASQLALILRNLTDRGSLEVMLFAPAHRCHVRQIPLQKGQAAHLQNVVPFLMETHVGQPVDELHWVSEATKDKQQAWVVATAHSHMAQWLAFLQEIGAQGALLLPAQALLLEETEATSITLLDMPMQHFQGQWLALPTLSQAENGVCWDENQVAQRLASNKHWRRFNLLTGQYSQRQAWLERLSEWRGVAAVALLALGFAYGWQAQQIQALERETAQLEAQASRLFLQLAPEAGRVVNLSRQLQGRLQQVSNSHSPNQDVSPYHLLAHLGQALQKVTGATLLEQVSLRDQVYRIVIQAPQREQLEQLQQVLTSPQWQVQLEQVVRVEAQYRGSFRLQGGAQ
ncbi:hypothetical protein FJM67_10630 [Maribrevibacterium harenarium]|uniref:Type II secretion system protein L n=1 Tax=Maribrevibacterium harenarium TaxID=2589817 RepID=A0A501WPP7_9GAMM|nr:type II secretion system protein GspL [Maribrevibacterium harenarium]TPE50295.1 hypothetical protein FJM67_10630 [Maribrevibacterium harenarium]